MPPVFLSVGEEWGESLWQVPDARSGQQKYVGHKTKMNIALQCKVSFSNLRRKTRRQCASLRSMVVSPDTKRFICEARLIVGSASLWYHRKQSVNFWQRFLNVPQNCNLQRNDEEDGSKFVPMPNHACGYKQNALTTLWRTSALSTFAPNDDVSKFHKKVAPGLYATRMRITITAISQKANSCTE